MISHYRQSEISFWLLVGIAVAILGAAGLLIGGASAQILAALQQPACGCNGPVTFSIPLISGGVLGLALIAWTFIAGLKLLRQTRLFINGLLVIAHRKSYQAIRDNRAVAFTAGLLRPRIYLSTTLLSRLTNAERRAVVRHERFHAQRFDPLRIAVSETIARAFRWLPGMLQLYRHWRLMRELAADGSSETISQRHALGRSLVKLLEQPLLPTAVSAFSATEERVRELVNPSTTIRRQQWLLPIVASTIILAAGIGVMAHGHQVAAMETSGPHLCPLTRQCVAEQLKKQSVSPVYVVCAPFSPAGGCFVVQQ